MSYMTVNQITIIWNISQRRVQILCADGRTPCVFKLGETCAIPADAKKPEDPRKIKTIVKDKYNNECD